MTRTGVGLPPDAHGAYAVCGQITRTQARNFAYGIALLPAAKRRAMTAVYATARQIDDIGDGMLPAQRKRELLARTREELHQLGQSGHPQELPDRGGAAGWSADPVRVALADAAGRMPIPLAAFDELIDGCEADVAGRKYSSFDELLWYCRCVAGSVGRLSVGVYDPADIERAWAPADALGVALQLTNILRDLREDRHENRVYLPQHDLDRFGCTLELDQAGNIADPPERFAALVRFEAARAEAWYVDGLRLLPMLDRRSAACTAAMAGIYHRLLQRIAAEPDTVRSTRLSLSAAAKLAVAVRALTAVRA